MPISVVFGSAGFSSKLVISPASFTAITPYFFASEVVPTSYTPSTASSFSAQKSPNASRLWLKRLSPATTTSPD
jgi:hypothetical protein